MVYSTVIMTSSSHACIPKSASPIIDRRKLRCCSTSVSTHFDLRTYWTALIKEIDQKLNDAVAVVYPERLHEAMRYTLLTKGAKRVPPLMCIAACELFGGSRFAAFPTACALEMVHVARLVHDELPCMDDSPSQRGEPSSHTVFGADMALLTGGALAIHGIRLIVSDTPTDIVPETRILQITAETARAIGSTCTAHPRFLELGGVPNDDDFVTENKFGKVCQCSTVCGGLLVGASSPDEIEQLRKYGQTVGVLYQLVDDILEATTEKNKDAKDIRKGKKSYVSVYGVEKGKKVAQDLRSQAKKELDGFEKYGEKVLPLYNFVDYAADRGFNVGE